MIRLCSLHQTHNHQALHFYYLPIQRVSSGFVVCFSRDASRLANPLCHSEIWDVRIERFSSSSCPPEPPCGVVLEFLSLPLLHPANTLKHRTNTSRMLKIFFAFTDKNSFPVSLLCLFYHTIPEKSINVLQGK